MPTYRTFLFYLFFFCPIFLRAQEIPVFSSEPLKDAEYFESYEDGPAEFLPGCSWYCGGTVQKIRASSHLPGGKFSYTPENAHDFKAETAWVEGVKGDGIGEWIEYDFNFDEMEEYEGTLGVTHLLIANGYKKSERIWRANGRIRQLKIYLNGKPYGQINLQDVYSVQRVPIGQIMFPAGQTTTLRFEIQKVYPGEKYRDTALSLLMFEGVGVH